MLDAASKGDLVELIKELMGNDLSIRRICINHLKEKITVSSSVTDAAESSAALNLSFGILNGVRAMAFE